MKYIRTDSTFKMYSLWLLLTATVFVYQTITSSKNATTVVLLTESDPPTLQSYTESVLRLDFEDTIISVKVDVDTVVNTVDERYLSVSLSPRHVGNASAYTLFRSEKFGALLQGLSPCYLRIGGTAAGVLTFNSTGSTDNRGVPDATPNDASHENLLHKFKPFTVTGRQWDLVNEFAQRNGARLIFGVNDLKRVNQRWNESNFLELLNYTINKPYVNNLAFEFGNEPNAYKKNFNLTINATEHAQDFVHFNNILKHQHPYSSVFNHSMLIGPDVTQPKPRILRYLTDFLNVAGQHLDKISWHQYYLRGKSTAPLGIANFTDPSILDYLAQQIQMVNGVVETVGFGDTSLWLGETGSASGGGVHGYSNTYVAVFMWLDKLGLAAQNGIDVVIRQSLYGYDSNYALVDDSFELLPDYWVAYIFKKLVGNNVIKTEVCDPSHRLRCYSAKQPSSSNITVYCLNLNDQETHIKLDINGDVHSAQAYVLTSHGTDALHSKHIQLNGKKLEMEDNTHFPTLRPVEINPHQTISVPAFSVVFYTVQINAMSLH